MRTGQVAAAPWGPGTEVRLPVAWEVEPREDAEVWFRLPAGAGPFDPSDTSFALAAALLPALKRGEDLRVEGAVSPALLARLSTIQDIYASWGYGARRIAVAAPAPAPPAPRPSRGVGCFFTGGVDSYYTLFQNLDEITHLVYVHGFDVTLEDRRRRDGVSALLRRAAAEFGKPLLELETNLRDFSSPVASWDHYHGAALATVALLLSGLLHKVFVPATFTYADLVPLGSHPLLDPLWGTEALELVHHGCEASRVDKVRRIAESPLVRETLRVCWEHRSRSLNCGACEKCLRTMVCTELAGPPWPTFPARIDLAALAHLKLKDRWTVRYEQLREAAERGGRRDLEGALRAALSGKNRKGLRRAARKTRERLAALGRRWRGAG